MLVVALMLVLAALTVMGVLDYVVPKDFLLDPMAREYPLDFLHVPYLQVLLYLFRDLGLENIDEKIPKNYFLVLTTHNERKICTSASTFASSSWSTWRKYRTGGICR